MRMIGIGLMGFLFAGVALLLSTMNLWERAQWALQTQINGPQLVFETPATISLADQDTAVITRSSPDFSVILSGLPAYQGITFNLPLNARPTSGYLQIDATFQVLAGVEGVLRVSIDNIRRGEILLHPGEVSRSLQVPLSPTDLAREQLVVSFSLQGDGPSTQCNTDTGYAVIVEIETTSAVHLTLDRPLTTVIDRVNTWGGVVRVGWPKWLDQKEQARRLILATQLKQRDVATVFLDDPSLGVLSTVELREAFLILAKNDHTRAAITWPVQVAAKGANAGLRRFHDTTRWRINVDLREDHQMRIPVELDLRLALGRQALHDQWSIIVTLNGRLVDETLLDSATTHLKTRIELPTDLIAAANSIEIIAASTRTHDSECNRPIELVAEMLPETALIAGDATFADPLSQLQAHLSDIGVLKIGSFSRLSATDADTASDLLAHVVPKDVIMKPETERADIVVVTPNDADRTLPDITPMWFAHRDAITQEVVIDPVVPNAGLPHNAIGLLIIPTGISLAAVSL
ncbi:MAG: hypothetical protein ABJ327_20750 [Litoreibacter sp.]